MVLTAIMVFLTYSPLDKTNFWIYWVSFIIIHILDIMFFAVTSFA